MDDEKMLAVIYEISTTTIVIKARTRRGKVREYMHFMELGLLHYFLLSRWLSHWRVLSDL